MDIEELKTAKRDLDMQLTRLIAAEVSQFRERTGFSPTSVDVRLIEVTRIGDKKSHYVVAAVVSDVQMDYPPPPPPPPPPRDVRGNTPKPKLDYQSVTMPRSS